MTQLIITVNPDPDGVRCGGCEGYDGKTFAAFCSWSEEGTDEWIRGPACLAAEAKLTARVLVVLNKLYHTHHVSEDCRYSCPKALNDDGESECCRDNIGDECNCGADWVSATIDTVLAAIKGER